MIEELFDRDVNGLINIQRKKINSIIKQSNEGFIILGTTELGVRALAGLQIIGIKPVAFVDDNVKVQRTYIDGIRVLSLNDAIKQFGKKVVYILATSRSRSIRQRLQELDISFISFAMLTWYYSHIFLPCFNLNLPYEMFKHSDVVINTASLWTDEKSKKEYENQIRWRMELDSDSLSDRESLDELYFPPDLFELSPNEIFFDCGAFDGDTIKNFIKIQPVFNHIIAIEPDINNYKNLRTYVSSLPNDLKDKITPYNIAVGKEKRKISFNMMGDMGSSIGGNETVDCDVIDNIKFNPTYIKMDIEGSELDALRGAVTTIKTHLPILAICLYHCPDDLWKIPCFIYSRFPEYKLFLRRYLDDSWETICYAVPENRLKNGTN